jgi:hypothetical protein
MLALAEELKIMDNTDYDKLSELSIEISKLLSGLIKTNRVD